MATAIAIPTSQSGFTEKEHTTLGPWRSSDLDLLPDNGARYELINGELFMSKSPHWHHQAACGNVYMELKLWCRREGEGGVAINPGVIFSDTDDVIPDVAWVSEGRLAELMDDAGHLTGAPDLAVEVLSFGVRNEERDRTAKRKLYETQGVREYWILDWRLKQVAVYRREQGELRLVATLLPEETLTSPLLPSFSCLVSSLFS
ncbi:MAG: Uma2 family endonuclease [Caldilineaceae bacterium]